MGETYLQRLQLFPEGLNFLSGKIHPVCSFVVLDCHFLFSMVFIKFLGLSKPGTFG